MTFYLLTFQHYLAPKTEIKTSMEEDGLNPEDFCTKKHGETWHLFGDDMNDMD